jgi:hypothetical protein
MEKNNDLYLGDIMIYFNIGGIIISIIYSVIMMRNMIRLHVNLDKEKVTPSDYAVVVRNIPIDMSPE